MVYIIKDSKIIQLVYGVYVEILVYFTELGKRYITKNIISHIKNVGLYGYGPIKIYKTTTV